MIIGTLYQTFIYVPLFNLLVYIYDTVPGNDIGVSIILLTLLVRLALYKMNGKAIKSQREMQELQPEIKEIQRRYKDDKEKQAQELMAVYQRHKVNPFGGCLPLLIQFPIIIALYQVFLHGFRADSLGVLYPFVPNPGYLQPVSFNGLVDLSQPVLGLALLAAVLQYFQTKQLMKVNSAKRSPDDGTKEEMTPEEKAQEFAQALSKNMMYTMPVLTFVLGMTLPSGLALYWSVTTLFAIAQQYLIIRKRKNKAE